MDATQTQNDTKITREQILKIFSLAFGTSVENPNPDEPRKPGPWDPVIREALDRVKVFGPQPEPWRARFDAERIVRIVARRFPQIWDAVGGGHGFDEVMLNPQPLPPRWAFAEAFAEVVIRRVELMREIAANFGGENSEQRGIIVVGGREFLAAVDEFCGNGFRLVRPRPHPPSWWTDSFAATDFLVMAAKFEQAAGETVFGDLQNNFRQAAAKTLDAALDRLQ